jgi:hypothetical protein
MNQRENAANLMREFSLKFPYQPYIVPAHPN